MEMPQIFENKEFGAVRTFRDKAGEPLFVAKDVALALGYEWNGNARIAHVPAEWRGVTSVVTPSGTQEMVVLTEQGLYFFLGRSDKPKALPFQKWLAGEVLPAIRKHGGYLTPKKLEEALLNPDVLIRLATQLKEEREARVQAEARVAILSHVRKTYTTTEIAKELGMRSAVALNRLLCERHIQFKQNGTYVLYAEYAEHGYQAGNPRKRQDRVSSPMDAARKGMAPGHARLKKVPATRLGGDFFHMSIMNPKAPDP